MKELPKAVLEYRVQLTVNCPSCGESHYQGPALNLNYTEAVAIGETRTCKHCKKQFLVTEEKLVDPKGETA